MWDTPLGRPPRGPWNPPRGPGCLRDLENNAKILKNYIKILSERTSGVSPVICLLIANLFYQ